jgi:6-pyruvoyltetrahydropterin/6-carboxytetrahydropterin synthase
MQRDAGHSADRKIEQLIARIEKTWSFDAAHQLPNHSGKCGQLHGHTYQLTLRLHGAINTRTGDSDEGMVMDYYLLSELWKTELEPHLDHRYLNESLPIDPTTAEMIAGWALSVAVEHLGSVVASCTVKETPATAATVWNSGD